MGLARSGVGNLTGGPGGGQRRSFESRRQHPHPDAGKRDDRILVSGGRKTANPRRLRGTPSPAFVRPRRANLGDFARRWFRGTVAKNPRWSGEFSKSDRIRETHQQRHLCPRRPDLCHGKRRWNRGTEKPGRHLTQTVQSPPESGNDGSIQPRRQYDRHRQLGWDGEAVEREWRGDRHAPDFPKHH